jgi:hypothetical protein
MKRAPLLFILLFVAALLYYGIAFTIEYERAPLDNRIEFAERYLDQEAHIVGRSFVGSPEAPITIIYVVDFLSEEGEEHYTQVVEELSETYIAWNQAKLFHKWYVTEEEYEQKRGRFKYAVAASCYKLNGEDPIGFHRALLNSSEEELPLLTERFGLDETYNKCLESIPADVTEDMFETRLYRIVGPSMHIGLAEGNYEILQGTPTMARINRSIRTQQVRIGI